MGAFFDTGQWSGMGRFAILAYVPLRSGCNHIFGPDIGVRLGPCRRPERQSIGKVQRCNIILSLTSYSPDY